MFNIYHVLMSNGITSIFVADLNKVLVDLYGAEIYLKRCDVDTVLKKRYTDANLKKDNADADLKMEYHSS